MYSSWWRSSSSWDGRPVLLVLVVPEVVLVVTDFVALRVVALIVFAHHLQVVISDQVHMEVVEKEVGSVSRIQYLIYYILVGQFIFLPHFYE